MKVNKGVYIIPGLKDYKNAKLLFRADRAQYRRMCATSQNRAQDRKICTPSENVRNTAKSRTTSQNVRNTENSCRTSQNRAQHRKMCTTSQTRTQHCKMCTASPHVHIAKSAQHRKMCTASQTFLAELNPFSPVDQDKYFCNSVDPDEIVSHLIWIYTVCIAVLYLQVSPFWQHGCIQMPRRKKIISETQGWRVNLEFNAAELDSAVFLKKKVNSRRFCLISTLTILRVNLAHAKLITCFLYSQKIGFGVSFKLSPKKTICTKCKNLFSRKQGLTFHANCLLKRTCMKCQNIFSRKSKKYKQRVFEKFRKRNLYSTIMGFTCTKPIQNG